MEAVQTARARPGADGAGCADAARWTGIRDRLLAEALRRGWAAAGVARVRRQRLARERGLRAVAEGRMDGMPWFHAERVRAATDLRRRYPWARSLVALAWPYAPAVRPGATAAAPPGAGRISAYACLDAEDGADYHDVLAARCDELAGWLRVEVGGDLRVKRFVDHGWAMDRAAAEDAGLGFAGKNACLITPGAGSYVLLAEMLLSVPLPATRRSRRGCGRCAACIPSCPTGAIRAPGVIDATRCISYLTIEHRGPIPLELRPLIGDWVFGCDLCQEACPINARLAPQPVSTGAGAHGGPQPFTDLVALLSLDDRSFEDRFRRTALSRTGRAGLARNAAIALGNVGDASALGPLRRAGDGDPDPVVREAARWAMERVARRSAG